MRYIFFLSILFFVACIPPSEEEFFEINIDYKDPGLRKILDLQQKQNLDSLLLMTGNPNPTYRLFAAKAFGSFQDEAAYDSLASLLQDPFIEVRAAAAYALGQLRNPKANDLLLNAFAQQDSQDVNSYFNSYILEGMGKIGSADLLESLATVSTYRNTDTLLLKGQAEGLYQYGLRKIFHPSAEQTMLKFLTEDYPLEVKKIAANYFHRFAELNVEESKFQLMQVMQNAEDPDIRMGLATALTRKGFRDIRNDLFAFYGQEEDYRVKVNILRQIHNYPYINIVEKVLQEIGNENPKVGLAAAEYLLNHGNGYDAPIYRNFLKPSLNPFVKIKLHQAILRNSGTNSGSRSISTAALKGIYEDASSSEYVKAAVIDALAEDGRNYTYLSEKFDQNAPAILKTKTVEAMMNMLRSEKFDRFLGAKRTNTKANIIAFIKRAIESEDGGMIAAATSAFGDEKINIEETIDNTDFMTLALNKLKLPDQLETYNFLNAALAKVKNQPPPKPILSDNIKPINWDIFDEYSAKPKAKIATTKGEVVIEMYKNESPSSVLNFIELSKSGYYNNKFFHRVVPNFVAQAGCPQGDGYGSLDYTIRSEVSPMYYDDEGYIGYASAGPHTESSQWFITHSPTPHLNGKYSIFGKVTSGMDVVHNLEIGDKINRVAITN